MKKTFIYTTLTVLTLTTGIAQASHHNMGGGFKGPEIDLTTVQDALNMKDDSHVRIKGSIEKSLGDEKYLFKDSTGTIKVEIDDKHWKGQTVTPADTVIISGEIDKEWNGKTEIDVDRIEKQ